MPPPEPSAPRITTDAANLMRIFIGQLLSHCGLCFRLNGAPPARPRSDHHKCKKHAKLTRPATYLEFPYGISYFGGSRPTSGRRLMPKWQGKAALCPFGTPEPGPVCRATATACTLIEKVSWFTPAGTGQCAKKATAREGSDEGGRKLGGRSRAAPKSYVPLFYEAFVGSAAEGLTPPYPI